MALTLTRKEEAAVLRRRAAQGRQKLRGPKLEAKRSKPKAGRERDLGYLSWLHDGLPCIACLRFGATGSPIEAAHQKVNAPSRGVFKKLGVRPDDAFTAPLCASHHREGPLRCDPAQGKFWAIVGLDPEQVADFCLELHAAYQAGDPGQPIVQRFADLAAGRNK